MWQTCSPLLRDYTNLVQDRTYVEAYVDAVLPSPALIIVGFVETHNRPNPKPDIRSPMRVNGCLRTIGAIPSNLVCRRSREGRLTIWG